MKTILVAMSFLAISGCSSTKELQVEMVDARLVKIDTVYRQSYNEKQQLTWRDQDNIEYTSFASMSRTYPIGTIMTLLRMR